MTSLKLFRWRYSLHYTAGYPELIVVDFTLQDRAAIGDLVLLDQLSGAGPENYIWPEKLT